MCEADTFLMIYGAFYTQSSTFFFFLTIGDTATTAVLALAGESPVSFSWEVSSERCPKCLWCLEAASRERSTNLRQGCKLQKHWGGTEGPSAGKGYLKMIADLKPWHTLPVGSQKCRFSVRAQKEFKEGEIQIPIF